jgi:aryl-alcohol dehydrogenase-like predicted oxidoreductase
LKRAATVHPISALQSEYSVWSRDLEADVIPACRAFGVTIVAYSPLGRGFLTGRIKRYDDLASDDYRRTVPRFHPQNFRINLDLVHELETMASEKNVSASQLALAWVMAQGEDVVPIPGTKRRTYLQENVRAPEMLLDMTDLRRLAALSRAAGARYDAAALRQTHA